MWRGAPKYIVGFVVVVGVAACGKHWIAERDAWRHDAEVACLKAGVVKEGPSLIRISPITGPGICGADFPLKVAALGEGAPIAFADDPRPPGIVPQPLAVPPPGNYSPRAAYPAAYQQQPSSGYPARGYPSDRPMAINPPGVEPAGEEEETEYEQIPAQSPPRNYQQRPQAGGYVPVPYEPEPDGQSPDTSQPYPQQSGPRTQYPQPQRAEPVPLGRERPPMMTGAVTVHPTATLACPIVSALDTWFAGGVQPAAMKWFGVPVAEIKQISAYSCRGMNGQPGAHISEHAFGNALDIAAFTLADGRKVVVKTGWRGAPEEQGFLRDVQASACQQFSTVLHPARTSITTTTFTWT